MGTAYLRVCYNLLCSGIIDGWQGGNPPPKKNWGLKTTKVKFCASIISSVRNLQLCRNFVVNSQRVNKSQPLAQPYFLHHIATGTMYCINYSFQLFDILYVQCVDKLVKTENKTLYQIKVWFTKILYYTFRIITAYCYQSWYTLLPFICVQWTKSQKLSWYKKYLYQYRIIAKYTIMILWRIIFRAVKALIFFNALTQCVNFLMH